MAILEIKDLSIDLLTHGKLIRPVDSVSFAMDAGEITGIVGESGSGKTLTCRAIANLLPATSLASLSGEITIHDSRKGDSKDLQQVAMIFQNPSTYLDPLMRIWRQIAEPLLFKEKMSSKKARSEAVKLMVQVGIPDPDRNADAYPHQLSGGMKQRVMIAAALACRPTILIADEPTTALDVTIQMQILRLLLRLRNETGLTIIFVTHDLAVVSAVCDRINVMYCGKIVEQGALRVVLREPAHPYTRALLRSSPTWARGSTQVKSIKGQLPSLTDLPKGCRFHPRCEYAIAKCRSEVPSLEALESSHKSACFRAETVRGRHGETA